jgi:hypothetical protein
MSHPFFLSQSITNRSLPAHVDYFYLKLWKTGLKLWINVYNLGGIWVNLVEKGTSHVENPAFMWKKMCAGCGKVGIFMGISTDKRG